MTKTNLINYKAILRILGSILLIIGISMIIPLIYAVVTGDSAAAGAFAKCAPPTILGRRRHVLFYTRTESQVQST